MTHKAIPIFLALGLCGTSHAANWVQVQAGGGTTQYYDSDSVRKSGTIISLRLMHDNDKPHNPGTTRRHRENRGPMTSWLWNISIDCAGGLYKMHDVQVYSDHLGTGNLVSSEAMNRGWVPMSEEKNMAASGTRILCTRLK